MFRVFRPPVESCSDPLSWLHRNSVRVPAAGETVNWNHWFPHKCRFYVLTSGTVHPSSLPPATTWKETATRPGPGRHRGNQDATFSNFCNRRATDTAGGKDGRASTRPRMLSCCPIWAIPGAAANQGGGKRGQSMLLPASDHRRVVLSRSRHPRKVPAGDADRVGIIFKSSRFRPSRVPFSDPLSCLAF